MFRRTFKRILSTNHDNGNLEDVDETGVDIVEAIDFVNSVWDEDTSKDFSEKEIKISENIFKGPVEKISHEKCQLISTIQSKTETVEATRKPKPSLPRFDKEKIKVIETKFRGAIQRGRLRFCKQLSFHQVKLCLPLETFYKTEVPAVDGHLDENTQNGFYNHSLQEFLCRDNNGKSMITFSVKLFTPKMSQWFPSKIECNSLYKDLVILTKPSVSFNIHLESVASVKVEDNRRILWMKTKSATSSDVVGFLFDKNSTLERFMLLLDYATRCRGPSSQHPFLNGSFKLSLPEKPYLFSCSVTWLPSHHLNIEFLGFFSYHLKTAAKEIRSIKPAQFFSKAGYIYIFEKDSDILPSTIVHLEGSTCSINHSFKSFIELSTDKQTLLIYTKTLPVSFRIQQIISNNKVDDNEDESPRKMNSLLGICNDQLVWTVQANEIVGSETEAGCDNEHVNTSLNNHVNDCQDASEMTLGFKDILHAVVDSERRTIQIASAPAHNSSQDEDCSGLVGVGGTILFNNERDLFKFQHTLQACMEINMFNINSRQNSRIY